MNSVRRYLCFLAGITALVSLASAVFFLVSRLDAAGSSGWGQYGGFVYTYADWQYSPQASEIYFGISLTLFMILLCIFFLLSKLPTKVRVLSIAGVILFILNAFYIWTSDILYPQSAGPQYYVTDSIFAFVSVVSGNWPQYGPKFIDFGLPILAICVGVCGITLGRSRVDRVMGFFLGTSIAVFPLGVECHLHGLGPEAVTSYFVLSTTPFRLVTNDLILYLSGFIILFCLCVGFLRSRRFREA